MKTPKVVYLLKSCDGLVKVGVTSDFEKRLKIIEGQSGRAIDSAYFTRYCSNSFSVETEFKHVYHANKIKGEWYEIDYEQAKESLEDIFNRKHVVEHDTRTNKDGIDKLLDFIFE